MLPSPSSRRHDGFHGLRDLVAYSKVIESFPAAEAATSSRRSFWPAFRSRLGCALIVDYILTISVSVVSGVDAIFNSCLATFIR